MKAMQFSRISSQHAHTIMHPPAGRSLLGAFQRSLKSARALALGGAAIVTTAAGETYPAFGPASITDT